MTTFHCPFTACSLPFLVHPLPFTAVPCVFTAFQAWQLHPFVHGERTGIKLHCPPGIFPAFQRRKTSSLCVCVFHCLPLALSVPQPPSRPFSTDGTNRLDGAAQARAVTVPDVSPPPQLPPSFSSPPPNPLPTSKPSLPCTGCCCAQVFRWLLHCLSLTLSFTDSFHCLSLTVPLPFRSARPVCWTARWGSRWWSLSLSPNTPNRVRVTLWWFCMS